MQQIRFSDFELDLELFQLKRAGQDVEIGRRALDLLACLIEYRDRVVTVETLRQKVWENAALSPSAIPTCVRELRRVIGDDAAEPRFIETIRGRGYRFIDEVVSDSSTQHSESPSAPPFVGRCLEQQTLHRALATTLSESRRGILVIRGEPGIGKTRLLNRFLIELPTNVTAYVSRSGTALGTPPFWPWIQVLRAAAERIGSANLRFSDSIDSLSSAFPELRDRELRETNGSQFPNRFAILRLWAQAIKALVSIQPVVLAFDDVHRADEDTLALLAWIADQLINEPLLIILAHRPTSALGPAAESLAAVSGLSHAQTIDLGPLSPAEIQNLIASRTQEPEAMSESILRRTNGNPLFITRILPHISSTHRATNVHTLINKLPSNAFELVSNQLADLPLQTREALKAATIAGTRFSITATASLLKISPEQAINHLEPAVRHRLIKDAADPDFDYAFSHSIFRDALYETIPSARRRQLHLDLAHELLANPAPSGATAEASDHLDRAMPLASPTYARRIATEAAREAESRFAFTKAQIFAERALRLIADDPNATPGDHCNLLLRLARAQRHNGNHEHSRSSILTAANIARAIPSIELLADCALQLSPDFASIEFGAHDITLTSLIQECLAHETDLTLSLRALLLARLSQAEQWSRLPEHNEATALAALNQARESGDNDAIATALSARAESLHGPAHVDQRIATLRELGTLTRQMRNIPNILAQQTRLVAALLEQGDTQSHDAENFACYELATETNAPQFLWYPESINATRRMMRGEFSPDLRLEALFKDAQGASRDANIIQGYACQQVYRHTESDKSREILPIVAKFALDRPRVHSWLAALAWIQWDSGFSSDAYSTLLRFTEEKVRTLSREAGGGLGMAALAEVASALGSRPYCELLESLIEPVCERAATAGYGVVYFGSFARYAGLLALSLGRPSRAVHHLRRAVHHEVERGAIVWQCYAELDLALALKACGTPSESTRATLHKVLQRSRETDSKRLARRVSNSIQMLDASWSF